jgi:uncharacterized phage protein (TIGR01671 family)
MEQHTPRVIKFRAWDTVEKRWLPNGSFAAIGNGKILVYDNGWKVDHSTRYILQQFTGLTDKNGVEIYEGDVVEIDGGKEQATKDTGWSSQYKAAVQWEEGGARYCLDRTIRGLDYGGHDLSFLVPKLSVIGNVYENPELLK